MTVRPPEDIRALTSLRFFAAVGVLLNHLLFYHEPGSFVHGLSSKLYLGVDLFFILSGFILLHVYQTEVRASPGFWRRFMAVRLARIYPVHVVTVLLALLIIERPAALLAPEDDGLRLALVANLGLVHGWGILDQNWLNFPSWSISAEFFAYLLFPLLAPVMLRLRPSTALVFGFSAVCLAFALSGAAGVPLTDRTFEASTYRVLPEFVLGMAIYRLRGHVPVLAAKARLLLGLTLVLLLALLLFVPTDLPAVLTLALVVLIVSEWPTRGSVMTAGVSVYLGRISYAFYMVHILVIRLTASWVTRDHVSLAEFAVVLALTLAGAVVLFHLVEEPARRAVRKRVVARG